MGILTNEPEQNVTNYERNDLRDYITVYVLKNYEEDSNSTIECSINSQSQEFSNCDLIQNSLNNFSSFPDDPINKIFKIDLLEKDEENNVNNISDFNKYLNNDFESRNVSKVVFSQNFNF